MVAAWMRAETGVGPAMASPSQAWRGNWADLPQAARSRKKPMAVSQPVLTEPSREAAETAFTEIQQQTFTHDGDSALGEHVSNCRVNEFKGRWSVKKESPKSSKKIDLAVCMIGARMLYRHVKNSKEWADLTAPRGEWKVFM